MSSAKPSARRKRGGGHDEEHVNHERWLVSYSDMITVLMALFIVLFAISQVDQEKYIALRESLASGFGEGAHSASVLDGSMGTMDGVSRAPEEPAAEGTDGMVTADLGLGLEGSEPGPAPQVGTGAEDIDPELFAAAKAEAAHLQDLQAQLEWRLNKAGLAENVRFRIDERGLVMGLVADDVFFAPARAELTPTAQTVLAVASRVISAIDEQISVEGHANNLPVSGRYATNWELSSDRATQVLRYLVEAGHVGADRVRAVGYGDARPLESSRSARALAANRRVDLVILSSAPETVRALVPAAAQEGH